VLIIFSDPQRSCELLAPRLVGLHERVRQAVVELAMVSRGAPEDRRGRWLRAV
jgi:hypothetical protein